MDPRIIFTVAVIIAMVAVLALELFSSSLVMGFGLIIFLFSGVIDPSEALVGFSNKGMITIAMLLIVAAGVQRTGAFRKLGAMFLGRRRHGRMATSLLRMMIPVSVLSAFLNNIPIVLMFTPIVKKWAEWLDRSASKFLIPLSYATIFGGACTLIGTSTNLVVHGMLLDNGFDGYSMFELAKIGVPCAVVGWLYLASLGHRFLPERRDIMLTVQENRKEYVIAMKVRSDSPVVDRTIKEAGLRNLKNVYLLEIERDGKIFGPVSPKETIRADDVLFFVGIADSIKDLQEIPGLVPASHKTVAKDFSEDSSHFVEAVISASSPILGRTVKEAAFRTRYKAGVIAIHRSGERVKGKIGDIRLRAGDVLLLLAKDSFFRDWSYSQDFYLMNTIGYRDNVPRRKMYTALGILAIMVTGATLGRYLPRIGGNSINMFYMAALAVVLMVLCGCMKASQIKRALDLNLLLTIACAFGISKALYNSGTADMLAGAIIGISGNIGPKGIIAGLYITSIAFSAIVTNNAAAALMFPIAHSAALQAGVDPMPFFVTITVAASASFSTPIGYQTNMIVQGAGGYKFSDYVKAGLPLNLLFLILSVLVIPLFWSF